MSDLRAMFVVARRELLERVRTRWFVATTLLGPIFMIALVVVPTLIAASDTGAGTKIEIIDQSELGLGERIAAQLRDEGWVATVIDPSTPTAVEDDRIGARQINGYLTIDKRALYDNGRLIYRGDNATNQGVKNKLQERVIATVQTKRGELWFHLSRDDLNRLGNKVGFSSELSTGQGAGASGTGAFLIAYLLAFVLYMVITLYGVNVMRSVVTEKTSRVMELMVAAVKPRALMAGKILGVGSAGLIQITIWLGVGAFALAYKSTILGWFGARTAGDSALPSFAAPELIVVIAFFLFGYFFYAAMYAAVGAMVSSEQDTQQVQMPVTMLLMIGVLSLTAVTNAPRGSTATVMTNVPLWSPMLMPMRYVLGGATLGEVAMSFGILVVSTSLIVRAAAKIYRTGVLMYGKRPSLGELVRWLRY